MHFIICYFTPYLKHLTKADNLKKHSLIALCTIALYSIYSIIGIISCFGPSRAANLFYPEYTMSQRIQLGGFIDFGELFFLMEAIVGLFLKYLLSTYGIYIIYKKYIIKLGGILWIINLYIIKLQA